MVHILDRVQRNESRTADGILPVKQERGTRTRDRLLKAGQRLIMRRDFDTMSVADIAQAAGCSVGAFYQRFRDKEAFFGALVAHYVSEARETTLGLYAGDRDADLVAAVAASTTARFRKYTGLVRTAVRRRMDNPDVWEPIRLHGHFAADCFIEWLASRAGRALTPDEAISVRFAFQVLMGTLNNAVVNQPGPLNLTDPEFGRQIERAFRQVLPQALLSPPR
jgi:AcrR family transcriptional regulator